MAQFWNQKAFKNTSEWHQKYIGMVPEIGRNGTRNRSEWHQICPKLAPEMVPKLTRNWKILFRRDLVTRLFRRDLVTRLFPLPIGVGFCTLLTFEPFLDLRSSICRAPKITGWCFFSFVAPFLLFVCSFFDFFLRHFGAVLVPFWEPFWANFRSNFGCILCRNGTKNSSEWVQICSKFGTWNGGFCVLFWMNFGCKLGVVSDALGSNWVLF